MTPSFQFDFQPLTRVLCGPGVLARVGDCVRDLGGKRIMLVTDPGLEEAGHAQRAEQYLRQAGLPVIVFDAVEENPTTKHVNQGLAVAQREKIDFIVALGGGSAMDCAKGINFLYTNGGEMKDYWGVGKATKPMVPSIGIPTTAGTGSEAQSFALVSDPVTHFKMACGDKKAAFKVALLDPELTLSQPTRVAALTAMDAVTHSIESHVSTKSTPLSKLFSREAWRLLHGNVITALQNPNDLPARAAVQWGAHLAGLAIENAMLGAAHALANPLTAHYGMVHGQAVGQLLPHVIRFNSSAVQAEYAELLKVASVDSSDSDSATALANEVKKIAQVADLPGNLRSQGVSEGMLSVLADEASQQWTSKFNPRKVGYNELLELYRKAL
ncbi:MAG: iron-containing alcohol dehydrogenase [Planctomycetia bacterium]|nr:iron-containing alcohol dehydrogenase [Planctomycetia bacterium]